MPGPHTSVSLSANLKQQHPAPTTPATSASARAESPGCFAFYAPLREYSDFDVCLKKAVAHARATAFFKQFTGETPALLL